MAIAIGDNLSYKGKKPDFVRQQYEYITDLASVNDNQMSPMYVAWCLENHKVYVYDKDNEIDPMTGRFRELQGSGNSSQVEVMPAPSSSNYGEVVQYIGETTSVYFQGHFYICKMEEDEYYWEELSMGVVSTITDEEIDEIFERLK